MTWDKFDCNNCKNFWLTKQLNLLERVINIKCSDNKNFNDPDNFAQCGPYQHLNPCRYVKSEQALYCGIDSDIDLKAIFHNFSKQLSNNEKHFKAFHLYETYIKVLEENTFNDITFNVIVINFCDDLTNIERYAFNTTDMLTKCLVFLNNNLHMAKTIYDILSSFVNIESPGVAKRGGGYHLPPLESKKQPLPPPLESKPRTPPHKPPSEARRLIFWVF